MGATNSTGSDDTVLSLKGLADDLPQDVKLLPAAQYTLAEVVGTGAFGVVYLAAANEQDYAVKITNEDVSIADIKREMNMLQNSKHPCIAHFHGVFFKDGRACFVMTYYLGGDLLAASDRHHEQKGPLSMPTVQNVIKMCVLAIDWLRFNHIVHCDVKAANIILSVEEIDNLQCRAYLCDFGTAVRCTPGERLRIPVGSPAYWAPEVWRRDFGAQIDSWALGVLCSWLIWQVLPPADQHEATSSITTSMSPLDLPRAGNRPEPSPEALEWLTLMLKLEEDERFTPEEALMMDFLDSFACAVELQETVPNSAVHRSWSGDAFSSGVRSHPTKSMAHPTMRGTASRRIKGVTSMTATGTYQRWQNSCKEQLMEEEGIRDEGGDASEAADTLSSPFTRSPWSVSQAIREETEVGHTASDFAADGVEVIREESDVCHAAIDVAAGAAKAVSRSVPLRACAAEPAQQPDQDVVGVPAAKEEAKVPVPPLPLPKQRQRSGDGAAAQEDVNVEKPEAATSGDNMKAEVSAPPARIEHSPSAASSGLGTPKAVSRRHLTLQAAGHGGDTILKDWSINDLGIPTYVVKVYDETEARNYKIMKATEDPLSRFTPHYDGEFEDSLPESGSDSPRAEQLQRYMRISNLLLHFKKGPHVMDCKLGIRSFTEAEVTSKKMRPDLYQRLKKLSPDELTQEEQKAEAITKHRWMTFNDNFTSLGRLGFRIDGICHSRPGGEVPKKELKALRENSDVVQCIITNFLPVPRLPEEESCRADVAGLILGRLQELRTTMKESSFVQLHSIIGTSLLFVADAHGPKGDVFLIDFAKSKPVPEGIKIDHVSQWKEGNHEDGILTGVDNIIKVWTEVLAAVRKGSKPSPR